MRGLPIRRGRRAGRFAARGTVLLLLLAQVVAFARTADAGTPWRFTLPLTAEFTIAANAVTGGYGTCPSGYIPVGGGLQSITPSGSGFERVAEYRTGARGYQVVVHNYTAGTITARIGIVCAYESDVGGLTYVSTVFGRDAEGEAGGTVSCPAGTMAITGGADWSTFNTNRRVDLTSPTPDGRSWYAAGWSGVAGELGVEAWCAADASVGVAAPYVTTTEFGGATDTSKDSACSSGRRIGAGGVLAGPTGGSPDPYAYYAHTDFSTPQGTTYVPVWRTQTHVGGAARIWHVVWCLPVTTPTVTITQGPAAHTNSTTATFRWVGSDPNGDSLSWQCWLDGSGVQTSCGPGSDITVTGVAEGYHNFQVVVYNNSKVGASDSWSWTVDTTAPDALPPPAGPSVNGPIAVTFSEAVTGVTTSSLQVRVAGQSATVPGSIAMSTTGTGASKASWTPSSPLVPGETYSITTTTAIKDLAGNALPSETFLVRTSRLVENTNAALREYWDPDSSSSASGGAYAVASSAGSSARWQLTATSGQTAALYGVRRPDGGYADVLVDGVRKTTVSFYGAATAYGVKLYTTPALSAGPHTVEVRVLGTRPSASTATNVAIDYLAVGSTFVQESGARQQFRRVSSSSAGGGSYDTVTHRTGSDTGGQPSYRVTVKGSGLRVYATTSPSGGLAAIYVDGVLKKTVSLASSSVQYKHAVYSISLTEARHAIKVVALGTSSGVGSTVAFDYLTVT